MTGEKASFFLSFFPLNFFLWSFTDEHVLVTGGCGFLGYHVALALADGRYHDGHEQQDSWRPKKVRKLQWNLKFEAFLRLNDTHFPWSCFWVSPNQINNIVNEVIFSKTVLLKVKILT